MYDIWNTKCDLAELVYSKANYRIKDYPERSCNTCYIFFSSNNIWYPNEETAFRRSFIENDYYEWMNYTEIPAKKIIWVRDIYKSWYVTGINQKLNTLDKVIEFLKKETQGMDVITVGSSAGGYMAALAASLLMAKYCICFSAQFDLVTPHALGVNPYLRRYENDINKAKYYNIRNYLKDSKTDVYYFNPAYVKADQEQAKCVSDLESVHIIKIVSRHHGVPVLKNNILWLLKMDEKELYTLFKDKKEKNVGRICFSIKLCGVYQTIIGVKRELLHIVRK